MMKPSVFGETGNLVRGWFNKYQYPNTPYETNDSGECAE
jgi:hypothetical protein